jgi:nitrate reductase delta subunit
MIFKILSRLLDYPDRELVAHLSELRDAIRDDPDMGPGEREVLAAFVDWLQGRDLTALQGEYVQCFDLNPDHSLHLTHHSLGDDRGRGPALIELDEHYKAYGLEANARRELPDYLPLILEYVSVLEETEARWFLGQMRPVVAHLAENLKAAGSPYASLLKLVAERARLIPQPQQAVNL